MAAARRTRYLDGLRGLAALQVVLHHTYLTVYPLALGVYPTGLTKLVTSSMMIAGLGVTMFVVLSGYSLSMSAHRHGWTMPDGTKPFLYRRARRLLPAYYVALLISIPLGLTVLSERTGSLWDTSIPFDATDVLGHALLAQDIVGYPYAINHPLWSISMTFHLYLLFPLFAACAVRWGITRVAMWAIVVSTPIAIVAFSDTTAPVVLRQFQFVGEFAAGMATLAIVRDGGAFAWRGRTVRPPWTKLAIGCFAVWVLAPANHLNHLPFALGLCCLLVELGTGGLVRLRRALEWRGIAWVGSVSLSLYLIHALVVHAVWLTVLRPAGHGVGHLQTLVLLLPLAVGASLFAAFLFARFVERPLAPRSAPIASAAPERAPRGTA